LEFEVGDRIFLKVSPTKEIKRFGMMCKLGLRYIGPYPITQQVGEVAYQLGLPSVLLRMNNVLHVLQLHKYIHDPSHVIRPDPIHLQ